MMLQSWIPILINIAVYVVTFAVGWGKLTAKIAEIENKYTDLKDEIESIKSSRVHNNQFKLEIKHIRESLEKLHNINSVERMARMEEKINSVYDMVNVMLKKQGNER